MASSNPIAAVDRPEEALSRQDWVLLPLLSLLTVVLLTLATELLARHLFYQSPNVQQYCAVADERTGNLRWKPNCICRAKTPESPWVEYRFNSCGHRAGMECGAKPDGVYRIVMSGTSTVMGLEVEQKQSFAALLPAELTRLTGRRIEIYNEASISNHPELVADTFPEVLQAHPDLFLWVLNPWDLQVAPELSSAQRNSQPHHQPAPENRLLAMLRLNSLADRISTLNDQSLLNILRSVYADSRTALMLEHFLYQSQSQYIQSFLGSGDAWFLTTQNDAQRQFRMQRFAAYDAQIGAQASAAGVPVAVVLMPNRAQAALLSRGEWPAGCDPYRLNDELRSIVEKNGQSYLDILPAFREIPHPERNYFPVDTHPTVEGHALLATLLAKELSEAMPELWADDTRPTLLEGMR
jgi:hypothetical protein